jgi:hypothetical protein
LAGMQHALERWEIQNYCREAWREETTWRSCM